MPNQINQQSEVRQADRNAAQTYLWPLPRFSNNHAEPETFASEGV